MVDFLAYVIFQGVCVQGCVVELQVVHHHDGFDHFEEVVRFHIVYDHGISVWIERTLVRMMFESHVAGQGKCD